MILDEFYPRTGNSITEFEAEEIYNSYVPHYKKPQPIHRQMSKLEVSIQQSKDKRNDKA